MDKEKIEKLSTEYGLSEKQIKELCTISNMTIFLRDECKQHHKSAALLASFYCIKESLDEVAAYYKEL